MKRSKIVIFKVVVLVVILYICKIMLTESSPDDQDLASNKEITIFMATGFFDTDVKIYHYIGQCSKDVQTYCEISSKRRDFEKESAVVFHARDYRNSRYEVLQRVRSFLNLNNIDYYFNHRNPSVPYVIWTFESSMNEQDFPKPPHIINWTMSYKLSSDVPFPYGAIRQKPDSHVDLQKIWEMKKTSTTGADIAWMVSNCDTPNKRMEIVKKLQELGLKIDIFGTCGIVAEGCSRNNQRRECETELISPYKFYIAMENSNCKDYVTEKFWRNMETRMTVPIVLGKKTYVEGGIPESSFIAIDDFENLSEFSKFMNSAIHNETKYLEFHEWRKNYEVIDILQTGDNDYGFCKLCQKLHSGEHLKTKKWYNQLMGKWHTTQECDNEVGYRFLD